MVPMCTMNYQRHAALTGKSVQNANLYANCKGMEFFYSGYIHWSIDVCWTAQWEFSCWFHSCKVKSILKTKIKVLGMLSSSSLPNRSYQKKFKFNQWRWLFEKITNHHWCQEIDFNALIFTKLWIKFKKYKSVQTLRADRGKKVLGIGGGGRQKIRQKYWMSFMYHWRIKHY